MGEDIFGRRDLRAICAKVVSLTLLRELIPCKGGVVFISKAPLRLRLDLRT
jgi:hypothetical protein